MPQTYTLTGTWNNQISRQLGNWAETDDKGIAFDSSTGWVLPNGTRRSPDAAWIRKQRIQTLHPAAFSRYWPICPDFVIELRSQSDRIRALREKMAEWLANGASLGWLIDPESRTVEIYRPSVAPEPCEQPSAVAGEGPVEGFLLNLARVWNPLA
jgi:Uma2 family endonuclease